MTIHAQGYLLSIPALGYAHKRECVHACITNIKTRKDSPKDIVIGKGANKMWYRERWNMTGEEILKLGIKLFPTDLLNLPWYLLLQADGVCLKAS